MDRRAPEGYETEQALSISLGPNAVVLPNFPSFNWFLAVRQSPGQ